MSRPKATSFLSNISTVWAHSDQPPYTATFLHSIPGPARGVLADCIWWPPVVPDDHASGPRRRRAPNGGELEVDVNGDGEVDGEEEEEPEFPEPGISVMLFIPGNPGLVQFYQSFLDAIHHAHPSLGILAHSHLGHAPSSRFQSLPNKAGNISRAGARLEVQVASAIEAYDALVDEYRDVGGVKVILVGHSVGAWVCAQVMKARPEAVDGAFLLFPTLSDIASTPRGLSLRLLFNPPITYLLTILSWLLFSVLLPPRLTLSLVNMLMPHWPLAQQFILRSFLRSPRAVYSALTMGSDEMRVLRGLHEPIVFPSSSSSSSSLKGPEGSVADVLRVEARRTWAYFGDDDPWVPERSAKEVFGVLRENGGARNEAEVSGGRGKGRFHSSNSGENGGDGQRKWREGTCGEVVFGVGVPHDFCINHEVVMAQLCIKWLNDGNLVPTLD